MPATFNECPDQNERAEALAYVRTLMEQARKESKHEDLPKLEKIIELIDSKRYGLVWEEHAELVEEEMKSKIPVFVEDESRKIKGNPASEDYHFLLEGDNLHSLHLLEKTHADKIDVIYIDPPYNTGNKDFIYNDKIVDKNDGYSHSKWLSFMSKRLEIAQNLLSKTGVIFISIDDNEQAQLKLLCDEVFGEENFIGEYIKQSKVGGGNDSKFIVKEHEFCLVYAKDISKTIPMYIQHSENYLKRYKEEDGYGKYFWDTFARPGLGLNSTLTYDIVAPDGTILNTRWIRSKDRFEKEYKEGKVRIIQKKNGEWSIQFKQYLNNRGKTPRSFTMDFGGTTDGDKDIKNVFGKKVFNYPKSIKYISTLISTILNKNATILDFFAGSGTTGHAVAQLNKEDGGNRKYILCTNNENNICEEVTYQRLFNIQDDLPHNLKYFKTQFIEKDDEDLEYALLNNVKTLIELEHAINLEESDKAVAFTLSEIRELDLTGIRTVYVRQHSHALMGKEDRVRYEGIELVDVPEYYFAKEMKEAGL